MSEESTGIRSRLYAAVWRWHFYAGLFAAPFLLILSVTGAIYLFNDEINDRIYPELRFASAEGPLLPPSRMIDSAQQAFPGAQVTRIDLPTAPGRSAQLFVKTASGDPLRVFVDPASAQVLGSFVYSETLVGFSDVAHGSLMLGDFGDAIVELAACWTVVLVITGVYLWWPRGRERVAGVVLPRLRARGRIFWRDLHKITGLYAAFLILFLLFTGLPWATIWGGKFLTPVSNALGVGYPDATRFRAEAPEQTVAEAVGEVPWTLQQAPMPVSQVAGLRAGTDHHAAHRGQGSEVGQDLLPPSIGVDAAAEILAAHGLSSAYRLSLPDGPTGAYTAYTYPDRPQGQRTLHIDRYSGAVLGEVAFRDYGIVAKAVELGVALHMGNYFGLANQIVMLLTCIAIIFLVVTGLVMWWRRRPAGGLGAPRTLAPLTLRNAALIIAALALLFPLAGASLVIVLSLDALLRKAGVLRAQRGG